MKVDNKGLDMGASGMALIQSTMNDFGVTSIIEKNPSKDAIRARGNGLCIGGKYKQVRAAALRYLPAWALRGFAGAALT